MRPKISPINHELKKNKFIGFDFFNIPSKARGMAQPPKHIAAIHPIASILYSINKV